MLNPLAFHEDRANDSDGPTPMRKVLRRIHRGARSFGRRLFPEARFLIERKIAKSFVGLVERGVDVCIVYSDNESYMPFVERALRPVRERLAATGRFRIEAVGGSDHIFSPLAVQAQVTATLIAYVGELTARAVDLSCGDSQTPALGLAGNKGAAIEQRQSF